jgi:putative DNA primase/helicase
MPNTACQRPQALPVQVEYIPAVLKVRPKWVGWHYAWRAGKWTKIPTNPGTGRKARSNDPTTWGSFLEALECCQRCRLDGIGFVFAANDPYCGVDLDECRDPATGQIEPWADTIIREVDSYSEISPSGTGVKLFARATLPPGGNRRGQAELYDRGRYFTVTGHHLPGTPHTLEDRQVPVTALHIRIFCASPTGRPSAQPLALSPASHPSACIVVDYLGDDEVLSRAFQARNAPKFCRL